MKTRGLESQDSKDVKNAFTIDSDAFDCFSNPFLPPPPLLHDNQCYLGEQKSPASVPRREAENCFRSGSRGLRFILVPRRIPAATGTSRNSKIFFIFTVSAFSGSTTRKMFMFSWASPVSLVFENRQRNAEEQGKQFFWQLFAFCSN